MAAFIHVFACDSAAFCLKFTVLFWRIRMALKECPSCAVDIDRSSEVCPICGYEFPVRKPLLTWTAVVLLILFIYPLFRMIKYFFY
jgi:hypothetical protein